MSSAKNKADRDKIPTAAEILEREDFLELWSDKLFLGHEFLTWLWLRTEENGRAMTLPSGAEVEVWFENKLQLAQGSGQNMRSISITTPLEPTELDWREAYTAVGRNKKVTKGTLRVKTDASEWRLTLPGDTLSPQGIKMTPVKEPEDEDDRSRAGKFLERVASVAELLAILEALFQGFINLRLSPEWETEELDRLRRFLEAQK